MSPLQLRSGAAHDSGGRASAPGSHQKYYRRPQTGLEAKTPQGHNNGEYLEAMYEAQQ